MATALAALVAPAAAQTGTTTVNATADISAAGGNAGVGDGTTPVQVMLAAGIGRVLRLSNVTGSLGCAYSPIYNADGVDANGNTCVAAAQISTLNSISGLSLLGSASS